MGRLYISESEVVEYPQLKNVTSLRDDSDIATLLQVYRAVRDTNGVDYSKIVRVMEDNGNYVMIMGNYSTGWDVLDFINSHCSTTGIYYTGANIGYLFPTTKSRGCVGVEMRSPRQMMPKSNNSQAYGFRNLDNGETVEVGMEFTDRREFLVGRSRINNNYVIQDRNNPPIVSKTHCKFYYRGNDLMVSDTGSKNGTSVNGRMLAPRQEFKVQVGDKVALANKFILEII